MVNYLNIKNQNVIKYNIMKKHDLIERKNQTLIKLGIDNSQLYSSSQLEKLLYWDEIIKRKQPKISGRIQNMLFFSAYWNNDLLTVINGEGNYGLHLLVYEFGSESKPEILEVRWISDYFDLEQAGKKSHEVREKLTGEMPILYKYSAIQLKYENNYNFPEVIVSEFNLPDSYLVNNPDKYFKPLDIVRVRTRVNGRDLNHAGIYLGNGKVCHVRANRNDFQSIFRDVEGGVDDNSYSYDNYYLGTGDENGWLEVVDLSNFNMVIGNNPHGLERLHSLIPYKNHEWVLQDMAKSLVGAKAYFSEDKRSKFKVGVYDDKSRDNYGQSNNCQNYANLLIHGIDVSQHSERSKLEKNHPTAKQVKNFGNLECKIKESHCFFNSLTQQSESETVSKLKKMINFSNHHQGNEIEAKVEVRPKESYRMNINTLRNKL